MVSVLHAEEHRVGSDHVECCVGRCLESFGFGPWTAEHDNVVDSLTLVATQTIGKRNIYENFATSNLNEEFNKMIFRKYVSDH